ncbi:hypothetical protein BKA62DRAFT_591351, partial [Auriculariales sp. MPI-PUGE-AT-0066]
VGEESAENALVFKHYQMRAETAEANRIEGWHSTLNVLLVFAALFSAVVTAFIIESYKNLRPRAYKSTSQEAQSSSATSQTQEVTAVFPSARLINALWFGSLILALGVSLLAILANQWVDEYKARIRAPAESARHWSRRHRLFSQGVEEWWLGGFITSLPSALHLALFLFLAGICILLYGLDRDIAYMMMTAVGALFLFYVVFTFLPLLRGAAPTITPVVR